MANTISLNNKKYSQVNLPNISESVDGESIDCTRRSVSASTSTSCGDREVTLDGAYKE